MKSIFFFSQPVQLGGSSEGLSDGARGQNLTHITASRQTAMHHGAWLRSRQSYPGEEKRTGAIHRSSFNEKMLSCSDETLTMVESTLGPSCFWFVLKTTLIGPVILWQNDSNWGFLRRLCENSDLNSWLVRWFKSWDQNFKKQIWSWCCVSVLTTVGRGRSGGMAPLAPDPGFARAVDTNRVTADLHKKNGIINRVES